MRKDISKHCNTNKDGSVQMSNGRFPQLEYDRFVKVIASVHTKRELAA